MSDKVVQITLVPSFDIEEESFDINGDGIDSFFSNVIHVATSESLTRFRFGEERDGVTSFHTALFLQNGDSEKLAKMLLEMLVKNNFKGTK